jgi:hypothetical protein
LDRNWSTKTNKITENAIKNGPIQDFKTNMWSFFTKRNCTGLRI